jgi:small subunit ribosomal protein S2
MAKRVAKMKEYQRMQDTGAFDEMPKKEALMLSRELAKLERNLSGISMLKERPQVVFVLDTKKEHIAVTEANKLRIPVIAVVDTNCDPDVIDFVIPGNDDAIRSGELMCRVISEAVEEGQLIRAKKQGSQTVKEEEPVKEVEQQEAQKEATADFQEREKKVATEIATIPEQETEESAEEQGES